MEAHFGMQAVESILMQVNRSVPRLAYHEISDAQGAYRYGLTTETFKEHLSALQRFKRKQQEYQITFDDGHVSQIENALPILNSHSERAIFFITVGWTGKRSGYMNWNHLRELQACGHEVQSHGWSHTLLTKCSMLHLACELKRSKETLEDQLGSKVDGISMPGGRWNEQIVGACVAAGYRRIFTSDPSNFALSENNIQVMGRWMVTRHMDARRIISLLEARGPALAFLRARHRFKELFKSLIGDRMYQALWRGVSSKGQSLEAIDESYKSSAEDGSQ